jgi:hypothetical protein
VAAFRLANGGDEAIIRRRHAAYYATRAELATDRWRMAKDADSTAWLTEEDGDLRAALQEAMNVPDAPLAVRLAALIGLNNVRSGRVREGLARVRSALQLRAVPPAIRSEGLSTLAWLRWSIGEFA